MAEVKEKEGKVFGQIFFFIYVVCVAQTDLELLTLLPQPSICCNYRHCTP